MHASSPPPPHDNGADAIPQRMALVVALVSVGGALVSLGSALGWFGFEDPSTVLAPWDAFRALARSAVMSLTIAALHRWGPAWSVRAATLLVPFFLLPSLPGATFESSFPQAIWVPTLIASALTTLRWTIVVATVSAGVVGWLHAEHLARMGVTPYVVTCVILALVLGGRALRDRLLAIADSEARRAAYLSRFDALTGLPQRQVAHERIAEGIGSGAAGGRSLAVLMVDVDRFNEVNDALGHLGGDALLTEVARRLRASVPASDMVARFGGDEFTIVLAEVTERTAIDRVTEAVRTSMATPFVFREERVSVTLSIGIALYPDDGNDPDALLHEADQALYASKAAGRDRATYFSAALREKADERRRLVADLHTAFPADQLDVHYQPIIALRTGAVHHAEALLRWRHPARGTVSPAEFIPLAESTGLIHGIGAWVFSQAAANAARWSEAQGAPFMVGVNCSPAQFRARPGNAPMWSAALDHLRDNGFPGHLVSFEITEGLLLDDRDDVRHQLDALRRAGVAIALDDFGTGYSALAYLRKYDFDFLKIDRAFVGDLEHTSQNVPLCRAMIVMAHTLGMKVIAEGVETATQRDLLAEMGCDYAQGYFFARPMPAAAFDAFLAAWPHAPESAAR